MLQRRRNTGEGVLVPETPENACFGICVLMTNLKYFAAFFSAFEKTLICARIFPTSLGVELLAYQIESYKPSRLANTVICGPS